MQTHHCTGCIYAQGGHRIIAENVQMPLKSDMPENEAPTVRKTVSLPSSLWKQIDDFQFDNRIKRETEAIRRLIELGLEAARAKAPAKRAT